MGKYKYRKNIKYIDFFDFYLVEWIPRYEAGHEHARASLAVADLGFGNKRDTTVLRPLGGGTHVKFLTFLPKFFFFPNQSTFYVTFFPPWRGYVLLPPPLNPPLSLGRT